MSEVQEKVKVKRHVMIEAIYNNIYKDPKENKKHLDILGEVKFQDRICRDFCRILTEAELKELLQCKTTYLVADKARKYKYEKLTKNKHICKAKAKAKALSA